MKRCFDLFLSSIGLLFLSPLFLLIAVGICIDTPGPVFFRQERIGKDGVPFRIFKFRSMCLDAPAKGLQITVSGDSRVTRVGRFIRRTKVDELPQLINVFKGEMSLVGPRPEVPPYVALYDDNQRRVLSVRPGITDPASLEYADEERILTGKADPDQFYIREVMPRKLELNLNYIENMSIFNDLKIIFSTLARLWE